MSTVLVIRATGTQGTSVCRNLVRAGFTVRGLVRNSSDPRATNLRALGVILFEGTEDSLSAQSPAIQGCNALFLTLMPSFTEMASEPRQARIVVEAAKAAGVQHIVNSTSIGAGHYEELAALLSPGSNDLAVKSLEWKKEEEDIVKQSGIPTWTILRPATFMTNFLWPLGSFMTPELAKDGKFVTSYTPETVMPLIDPEDIGAFVAEAFQQPDLFREKTIELAGEKLRVHEFVMKLSDGSGRQIEGVYRSREETLELAKTDPIAASQLMTSVIHQYVDIERLKLYDIPLGNFESFLEREQTLVHKTFHEENENPIKLF
jgi:uncharacterized protein YbjT (DUF2867 family)